MMISPRSLDTLWAELMERTADDELRKLEPGGVFVEVGNLMIAGDPKNSFRLPVT